MNKNYTASGHSLLQLKESHLQSDHHHHLDSCSLSFHFTTTSSTTNLWLPAQHPNSKTATITQSHSHVSPFFRILKQVLILATKHATLSELSMKIEINRSGPNEALATSQLHMRPMGL